MNIGIELRYLVLGASGGVSQLVKGVCEQMFASFPEHNFFIFCTPFNRRLIDCEAKHIEHLCLPINNFFNELSKLAIQKEIQVLFRSFPSEDGLSFPNSKQIFLMPDIQHEVFPEFFDSTVLESRRRAFGMAMNSAGAIGTISEFAKKTIVDFPGNRCSDVFLMPPSLQESHKKTEDNTSLSPREKKLVPEEDFFIFPANIWPHKNHISLLQAFKLLLDREKTNVKLILTGHPQGLEQFSELLSALPVEHLGFVRPEFLRVLLKRSKALVFFSLYEGFGMPLLEAFDAGTPVICSNVTSLPEVGGKAVLSCDPTDVKAIAGLMEQILTDQDLRNDLIQKGRERLYLFSWHQSAQNLIEACERVASRRGSVSFSGVSSEKAPIPLVSIVTPSYNQGKFLKRTIDSVLQQNYPLIEYIVIDGGSKDDSVEILKSYGDLFYWVSEPDHGQTDAINKGLSRAKGQILCYLNSDDLLLPHTIEKVVDFFQQNPECGLVYGEAFYIDENDKVIGKYNTADYSFERLLEDCMVCQPATFWRREVMEDIGPLDVTLNFAMDYDYWLRIAKAGKYIKHISIPLACSRLYAETKTLSSRTLIYKEIFQICEKHVGKIHESYYHGWWNHLIFEKDTFLSRILRGYPKIAHKLPRIHFKFSQIKRRYLNYIQILKEKTKSKLKRLKYSSKMHLAYQKNSGEKTVLGYWPDNWLEPMVRVKLSPKESEKDFCIGGFSPLDLTMSISIGKQDLGQHILKANEYCFVKASHIFKDEEVLEIRFSRSFVDMGGRKLSFLLQETNIFSEQDLA